jgi:hypothetical protein
MITLAAIAVGAIVVIAYLAMNATYHSDSSMNALLFYRYLPATETSDSSVRVWGDVWNFNFDDVDALLRLSISDCYGHSSSHDVRIGVVAASGSVDVDEVLPWPYSCSSTDDLEVGYDVLTRPSGLL